MGVGGGGGVDLVSGSRGTELGGGGGGTGGDIIDVGIG